MVAFIVIVCLFCFVVRGLLLLPCDCFAVVCIVMLWLLRLISVTGCSILVECCCFAWYCVVFVVLVVFYVLWFDCCDCLLCGVGLTIVDCWVWLFGSLCVVVGFCLVGVCCLLRLLFSMVLYFVLLWLWFCFWWFAWLGCCGCVVLVLSFNSVGYLLFGWWVLCCLLVYLFAFDVVYWWWLVCLVTFLCWLFAGSWCYVCVCAVWLLIAWCMLVCI